MKHMEEYPDEELIDMYRAGNELKLSNNEWDMLKILVENKGRVVRRDVFFERLWDIHGN